MKCFVTRLRPALRAARCGFAAGCEAGLRLDYLKENDPLSSLAKLTSGGEAATNRIE